MRIARAYLEKAVQKICCLDMYLRTVSGLEDVSHDRINTIVFVIPMDVMLGVILGLTALAKAKETEKAAQPMKGKTEK